MDERIANVVAADPAQGGDVRTLNLPSLRDMNCQDEYSWTRMMTSALLDEGHWTVSASADGFEAKPTPPPTNFPSQVLTINVRNVMPWPIRFGAIHLVEDAGQAPDAHLTLTVQR